VIPQDEDYVFNALQVARCLHKQMKRVSTQKGDTMFQEMKAEQFHMSGGLEVESATAKTSSSFVELRHTLPTHVDIVSTFVDQMMRFISRFRVTEGDNFEIELALREALSNAIVHGNQEDPDKCVYVKCRCTEDGEVSITIEDEGRGFKTDSVPDPTSPDNRLRTHGRGIYLMRTSMDEVRFERNGSVVHMRKNRIAELSAQRRTQ
jgi:serine/threonine-protein kinase RsbW